MTLTPDTIITGDCLAVMADMPDACVDAVVTDPPYYRVLDEEWDRAWSCLDDYLAFMATVFAECKRLLAFNGSLYCFCGPRVAGRLETVLAEHMHILNHIVWDKGHGRAGCCSKADLRAFFPASERILFAEQYRGDNIAKGETDYTARCDELRGFVFEPLRKYLADEVAAAGWSVGALNKQWQSERGTKGGMAGHWLTSSQWELPTKANYAWMRKVVNADGGDHLRREYEHLRREYEDLRRPFAASAARPYTDVWAYAPTPARPGRHPCEKPARLMEHIVATSCRPDALVLDPFAGSGSTLLAATRHGMRYIGIELDQHWADVARRRLAETHGIIHDRKTGEPVAVQASLFGGAGNGDDAA